MHKIVLTGGIASGKSEALKIFQELNVPVLDADKMAYDLLKKNTPAYKKVIGHFGGSFLLSNQEINRPMLGKLIFSNETEKTWLENLLHPLILEEIKIQLKELKKKKLKPKYCLIDIPLYAEIALSKNHPLKEDFKKIADRILVIDTEETIQKNRLQERYNKKNLTITEDEIHAILAAQASRLERRSLATDIIQNNEDLTYLQLAIMQLHRHYSQQ